MPRLAFCLLATSFALTSIAHADTADEKFKALYTKEWTWRQEQFPGADDEDNTAKPSDNRLPDVGPSAESARLAYWDDVLKALAAIPTSELSAENQVNYAIYKPQVENLAAGVRFHDYEMPFNS